MCVRLVGIRFTVSRIFGLSVPAHVVGQRMLRW